MSIESEDDKDDFEVAVEGEEDLDIQVVDTTPEKDKGKALLDSDKEDVPELDDDEVATYSEKVQKRIKDATFRFHDQRRKREAAEREREEATKFAQTALQKAQQLEAALYQYEAGYVNQAKSRVEIELAQAQAEMKAAFDVGDADKMGQAQAKIAKLAVQEDQYSRFTPREAPEGQTYQPQQQVRPADDDAEKFLAWRGQNKWFDDDETLRDFAMGVHTRIATSTPEMIGTEGYYRDIEKAVKTAFPSKFGDTDTGSTTRTRQTTTPVAGVSRNSGAEKTRKTVTLTRDQMALCRRLGITPQQYVREMNKTEG